MKRQSGAIAHGGVPRRAGAPARPCVVHHLGELWSPAAEAISLSAVVEIVRNQNRPFLIVRMSARVRDLYLSSHEIIIFSSEILSVVLSSTVVA